MGWDEGAGIRESEEKEERIFEQFLDKLSNGGYRNMQGGEGCAPLS